MFHSECKEMIRARIKELTPALNKYFILALLDYISLVIQRGRSINWYIPREGMD